MDDRQGRIPMYKQIEQYIRQKIDAHAYAYGEVIPSERELSERFQVSRMTVRQAITNLVQQGILVRERGRGTFVVHPTNEQSGALTTFTEEMTARGYAAHSEIVLFQEEQPPRDVQRSLQLTTEASVYKIERLCFANDEPIAFERTYIPVSVFPMLTLPDVHGSFYTFAEEQLHEKIGVATQHIEAAIITEEERAHLRIPAGKPVLHMSRLTKLISGKPVEVQKRTYRADRYMFTTTVVR